MKSKIGTLMMILGSALVIAALGLFIYNKYEEDKAAESVADIMPQLVEAIQAEIAEDAENDELPLPQIPVKDLAEEEVPEMTTVNIYGYDYIGFVGIPSLDLELPVMADWNYSRLMVAPCRYSGSIFTDDLVIMAHNFDMHFGRLSKLRRGDTVTYTDVDGNTQYYEVVAPDILDPYAVDEMTAGEYDLTLFTCTYGGRSRVTIRCDIVETDHMVN